MTVKTIGIVIMVMSLLVIYGCSLPQRISGEEKPVFHQSSRLFSLVNTSLKEHGGKSGVVLLRDGERALQERVHLADAAEVSIDAQYYIWNSDSSGKLLMQRLLAAAERGVRVRLLVDDFSVGSRNEELLALDSHKNFQVRVYNPFMMRSSLSKWLNFMFDFDRLNRRMHNKSFIVDSAIGITGGRNIGDEYFNHNEKLNFIDTDILSVGPVVQEVAASFSAYWESEWAVPISPLLEKEIDSDTARQLGQQLDYDFAGSLNVPLFTAPEQVNGYYKGLEQELIWAKANFIADQPGSGDQLAYSHGPKKVALSLMQQAESSDQSILIESAYFVVNEEALELVRTLKKRGVNVSVLTNSMASNDVLPNHASYAMVREEIVDSGIDLHELRPDAPSCLQFINKKEFCDQDSVVGLHAKSAVFDNEIVYVGSLNFNLRSAYLNTESAMIIESTELAKKLAEQIQVNMQGENSWRVSKRDGDLQWTSLIDGKMQTRTEEPGTTWFERMESQALKLIPGALYY